MPLRDPENGVYPYVSIAAQKGALPGTLAGKNIHHREVTGLLLTGMTATLVLVMAMWLVVKIKERK